LFLDHGGELGECVEPVRAQLVRSNVEQAQGADRQAFPAGEWYADVGADSAFGQRRQLPAFIGGEAVMRTGRPVRITDSHNTSVRCRDGRSSIPTVSRVC
jgi:hypothetical protein